MAKTFQSRVFTCSDDCCAEFTVHQGEYPDSQERPPGVPITLKMERIWIIRNRLPIYTADEERQTIEAFAESGVIAEWADTESDARAMAEEPAS